MTNPKPSHCTCEYPEIVLRNGCGHRPSCPVYHEWAEQLAQNDPRNQHTQDDRQRHKIPPFRRPR